MPLAKAASIPKARVTPANILFWVVMCYCLHRFFRKFRLTIFFNKGGGMTPILKRMMKPCLNRQWKPTPWLPERHTQTIWGIRFRRAPRVCRREMFTFTDGGTCALDFFDPPEEIHDPPVLLIVHTMAGGTREPCSANMAKAASKDGFRALVYNNRGCSGVRFTSRKFFCADNTDDLRDVVAYVRERYQPRYFFIVGFSLGGYTALRYSACVGDVDGIVCVSHTFNYGQAGQLLEGGLKNLLYNRVLMDKLTRIVRKNEFIDYPKALVARSCREFDREYTVPEFQIADLEAFWDSLSAEGLIPKCLVPTVCLCADNDPFTQRKWQPRQAAQRSANFALVTAPEGGHVSFPVGWLGRESLIEPVVTSFCHAVMTLGD